ncbi:hypothetical protein [Subtercola sp. RTI3]|nr:hypothetical protein [Subtercola sp. RTI3]
MRTVGIIAVVSGLFATAIPKCGLNVSLFIVGAFLIVLSQVLVSAGKKQS